ncbi:MAG: enoyl-CoA hydratase/isomerase family protein [Burkholderiaceae bacterium]
MTEQLPVLCSERETAAGRRIGFMKLNRPRQVNALTLQMCQLMLDQLRAWASDEGIVAVVLEGEGAKGLCAGGDVAGVIREVRAGGPGRFVYGDAFFEVEYTLDLLIHTYPKPLLSWSHGICMGGGVGLAVGASHRIVSEGSRIAMPEIHIGLFPDVGGGWFLNRVPGGAGTLMALTGMMINEADAIFAGLADVFVPEQARAGFFDAMLGLDWSGDAAADRARLTALCQAEHKRWQGDLPASQLARSIDTIRAIAWQANVADVRDALVAAADANPWLEQPAGNLVNGSPTAAHVTFEYLRRTRQMSIAEVLRLDLVLARSFLRLNDFGEGVRALLIDKDRAPKWLPARFEEVTPELVASHFVS